MQFHPESILSEHGALLVANFLGRSGPWMTSSPFFTEVAAEHPRCFWLDGGGAREWSGRRSMVGWLDDDDVSLTFHAGAREVRRHAAGRVEVVGSDVFEVLEAELAAGSADDQWFGYLGYAARPDLFPARPDPDLPDAVWMRCSPRSGSSTTDRSGRHTNRSPWRLTSYDVAAVPEEYAAAFDRVQEQLHAGNSYEVNLTYRVETPSDLDPLDAYLRLRAAQPGAVRRVPPARRPRPPGVAAELLARALRAGHGRPGAGDQADQGHHAARRDARRGRGGPRTGWRATRSSAART